MTLTGNKNFSVALSAFLKSLRVCLFYFILFFFFNYVSVAHQDAQSNVRRANKERREYFTFKAEQVYQMQDRQTLRTSKWKKKDRLLGLSAELHFPNMGGGNESKRTTPAGRQQLSAQHRKHSYPLSLRSQHLERWQYWKRFKECASSWTPCGKWSPKTYPAYKSGLQWMLPLQRNRLKSPYKDFYICKFHSHSSSKALQLLCVFSL